MSSERYGRLDVGIGHHDDPLVAQVLLVILRPGTAAERLDEVGNLGFCAELVLAGGATLRIFPRKRQHGLRTPVARLFGPAAGRVALDDEYLRALRGRVGAIGELAGQAQFAHRGLARDVFFLAAAQPLLGALDDEIQELVGLHRIARQPMVERILDRLLDDFLRAGGGSRSLVWPWNSGSRMNTESMQPAPVITSSLVTGEARFSWPARAA